MMETQRLWRVVACIVCAIGGMFCGGAIVSHVDDTHIDSVISEKDGVISNLRAGHYTLNGKINSIQAKYEARIDELTNAAVAAHHESKMYETAWRSAVREADSLRIRLNEKTAIAEYWKAWAQWEHADKRCFWALCNECPAFEFAAHPECVYPNAPPWSP